MGANGTLTNPNATYLMERGWQWKGSTLKNLTLKHLKTLLY